MPLPHLRRCTAAMVAAAWLVCMLATAMDSLTVWLIAAAFVASAGYIIHRYIRATPIMSSPTRRETEPSTPTKKRIEHPDQKTNRTPRPENDSTITRLNPEIERLRVEAASSKGSASRLAEAYTEISRLMHERTEKDSTIIYLNGEIERLRGQSSEIARITRELAEKNADIERLNNEIERLQGQGTRTKSDHASDDKFRAVKRRFASFYHPNNMKHTGIEKLVREEIFKEFWSEIDKIEAG